MRSALQVGSVVLLLSCTAGKSAEAPLNEPADVLLQKLAVAFDKQDSAAITPLIADGWSGLRFTEGWPPDAWHDTATSLRNAKLKSSTPELRTYEVTLHGKPKDVEVHKLNGEWKLDYNSFMGPFPHL